MKLILCDERASTFSFPILDLSLISGEELKVGGAVHGGEAKDLARRRAGR